MKREPISAAALHVAAHFAQPQFGWSRLVLNRLESVCISGRQGQCVKTF